MNKFQYYLGWSLMIGAILFGLYHILFGKEPIMDWDDIIEDELIDEEESPSIPSD